MMSFMLFIDVSGSLIVQEGRKTSSRVRDFVQEWSSKPQVDSSRRLSARDALSFEFGSRRKKTSVLRM
jgi:hypothetical protein